MKFTRNIKRILSYYESDNPGVKANLARILNGDEMAKFMSGNASLLTTCKIIISMPKIPFIKSFFYVVYCKWFNLA